MLYTPINVSARSGQQNYIQYKSFSLQHKQLQKENLTREQNFVTDAIK